MDPLDGLNPEQRRAAEAVRGPVCILAGAGSGKTTTITRRIAHQVASGAFEPRQIMAVTFTDKAAGELRARLQALGVTGVRAGTFHSAALRQLRHFASADVGRILPSKAMKVKVHTCLRRAGGDTALRYLNRAIANVKQKMRPGRKNLDSSAACGLSAHRLQHQVPHHALGNRPFGRRRPIAD